MLSALNCDSAYQDAKPLNEREREQYLKELNDEYVTDDNWWRIQQGSEALELIKVFNFKNFLQALAFTNQVGELAEAQNHHPSITTEWGKVTLVWWTHKVSGLHLNDFICAARLEQGYSAE
jgi:4a-hydroxytetrahydrobiopterin dehydratase